MEDSFDDAAGELNGGSSVKGNLLMARMLANALHDFKQGKALEYQNVLEHLSVSPMSVPVMQEWLQALSVCVSEFSKGHDQLISSTLKLIWYEDEVTTNYYIEYLTNLLSAHTHYLRIILSSLVRHFWSVPTISDARNCSVDKAFENVHRAVKAILVLIPTATSVFMSLLSKGYPFKGKCSEVQEVTLRNVLYVTQYCPSLQDSIFELVVHQMLSIDVELPNFESEEEDCEEAVSEEEEQETQFDVELDSSDKTDPPFPSRLAALHSKKRVMKNEQADKLDVMLTVCFQHLHTICHSKNGSLHFEVTRKVLYSLIKIFERVLLPTHACSNVQFLLFKITSLHQDLPGYFLDFLWDKFQDPNTPAVLRQTAAAYMASYIARSKFVSLETAKLCMTVMTDWIHEYLNAVSPENMKPDVTQHGPFFSLCQALFYVFVFRHKQLLDSCEGLAFLRRLNFEHTITSRLNPLKVCLPSVVEVFASITNRFEIVFCYTIMEQNKRVILTSAPCHGNAGGACGKNYLDCFFPFDPYHLKRSGKFICSLYQEWEGTEDTPMQDEDIASSFENSLPYSS